MKVGVVIPVGPGRWENVLLVLDYLGRMTEQPEVVLLVCDGPDALPSVAEMEKVPFGTCWIGLPEKHQPGMEQPRNAGVRWLQDVVPQVTHAWFLDSDIIVTPHALTAYRSARVMAGVDAVMMGPYYELLPPGQREPVLEMREDPRWPMFRERDGEVVRGELGHALGCWSGNLVWPIDLFAAIGGFESRLHHGRCEDGELGIRAARHRIPMMCVPDARGWHLHHERNMDWILATNAIDVPKIHAWHGQAETYEGLVPVPTEGIRLEWDCPICHERINTGEIWSHQASCAESEASHD